MLISGFETANVKYNDLIKVVFVKHIDDFVGVMLMDEIRSKLVLTINKHCAEYNQHHLQ